MKINEGEVPQYYVENSHPAIIEPEVFDMAQDELARRKQTGRSHHGTSCFAGKLVCGCCGGLYGSKVWHSTDKYRRVIWQCNGKFKGKEKCDTPHLTEEAIQRKFLAAFNELLENRDFILEDTKELIVRLTDTSDLEEEARTCATKWRVFHRASARSSTAMPEAALTKTSMNAISGG